MCGEHCDRHGHRHGGEEMECHHHPSGGWVRGFVQPRLLLLLLQKPSHGYELMERLAGSDDLPGDDLPGADPGLLYRTLRQLERDGLVASSWDTEGSGPARRLYQVTDEGVEYLHAWAAKIRATRQALDQFLTEYQAYFNKREEH